MGQKLGIVSFTEHGSQLNERLREMLERSGYVCESYAAEKYAGKYHLFPLKVSAKAWTEKMFQSMDALLFIGACGIAVRSIAPYLQEKTKIRPLLFSMRGGFLRFPAFRASGRGK